MFPQAQSVITNARGGQLYCWLYGNPHTYWATSMSHEEEFDDYS